MVVETLCRVTGYRGTVRVLVEEDRTVRIFEGAAPGTDAYPAGLLLAGLGSPPGWWPVAVQVRTVLDRCPEVPVEVLLAFVSASQKARLAAAKEVGVDTPVWVGWALATDPVDTIARTWVDLMPLTVPEFAAMLPVLLDDPRLRPVARDRLCEDVSMVEAAIESGTADDLLWAVRNVHTPAEWLPRIAEAALGIPYVCLRLVRDRDIDAETARILVRSPEALVRRELARKEAIQEEVWRPLLDDPDVRVAETAWGRALEAWPRRERRSAEYKAFRQTYWQWRHDRLGEPLMTDEYESDEY